MSLNSLREDLEVSYDTVKRWLQLLHDLYYIFRITPYSRSIPRALRKEGKIYLWDYSELENPGAKFENLVAQHLLKTCHYWTDTGEGVFDLHFLRNKEKQEIDFLITRNKIPWLPVEVKLHDTAPSPSWKNFLPRLPCKQGVQIVLTPHIRCRHAVADGEVLVVSAGDILFDFA